MVLIIVAPSFFDLNKYIAVHRSKCLLHVYTKGFDRGYFAYFTEKRKRILHNEGKKRHNSYANPRALFRSRFIDFKPPFYAEYIKTKERTLRLTLSEDTMDKKDTSKGEMAMNMLENNENLIVKDVAKAFSVSERTIFTWIKEHKKVKEGGVLAEA